MENEVKPDGRIYWGVGLHQVNFLIPKKRGAGFLKMPVGEHANRLSDLVDDLGYDCCGLDGYLEVITGFTHGKDFSELVNGIGDYYGMETVEVSDNVLLQYVIDNN